MKMTIVFDKETHRPKQVSIPRELSMVDLLATMNEIMAKGIASLTLVKAPEEKKIIVPQMAVVPPNGKGIVNG